MGMTYMQTATKSVSLLMKHRGETSFKCQRSVGSALYQKMKTPHLYIILKKKIPMGMIYTQSSTKSISLFNAYERLKSPSLFTVHF